MADTFTVQTMWNGVSRDVVVTNSSSKHSIDNVDRKAVVAALMGKDFHASSKAKGIPTGADAYLHISGTNTLYAIKKADVKSNQDAAKKPGPGEKPVAVAISCNILGTGSVNKGIHKF